MEEKEKAINDIFNVSFSTFKQENCGNDSLFYELYYLRATRNI
jgi:hypothetical protein